MDSPAAHPFAAALALLAGAVATGTAALPGNGNGTPLNPDDDEVQRRDNAGVDRIGGLLELGAAHAGGARTDLLVQASSRRLGVPEWRNAADDEARFDTDTLQVQIRHRRDGPGEWRSAHTGFVHATRNDYDDRLDRLDRSEALDAERGTNAEIGLRWSPTVAFELGATLFGSSLAAGARPRRPPAGGRERLRAGLHPRGSRRRHDRDREGGHAVRPDRTRVRAGTGGRRCRDGGPASSRRGRPRRRVP